MWDLTRIRPQAVILSVIAIVSLVLLLLLVATTWIELSVLIVLVMTVGGLMYQSISTRKRQ